MILLNTFLKLVIINICVCNAFFKLTHKPKPNVIHVLYIFISILILSFFQSIIQKYTPFVFRYLLVYLTFSIIYSRIVKLPLYNSIIAIIVSYALTYIANFISYVIILLIEKYKILPIEFNDTISIILASFINISMIYIFFSIKRFKNGFPFLTKSTENYYLDIFVLVINSIIILAYCFFGNLYSISMIYLTTCFLFFGIIMFIIIQKAFILYQKLKLQTKALQNYEKELLETKQKLEIAIQEKDQIVKSNHEFYHRQEALSKKLDLLLDATTSMNTEFAEEYSNIKDRIARMSNEYNLKKSYLPNLERTNLSEIDDMLIYMQSECNKSNIEFNIKINYDLNDIIDRYITISQLETLLGDLIRNAIIAINHSTNSFRSIMVIFGIKDDSYELCIFDSGIPFEIETLINLGLQPASTHINEGGTGIGFVTTFETINSCNASFIINENTNSNYSKSLEIKFDNKHEYVIISNRKEKIKEMNLSNRKIILK